MKTIYITEEQKNTILLENEGKPAVTEEKGGKNILAEENGNIKKKVKRIIRQYCCPQVTQFLDTPLAELPPALSSQLNPGGHETPMFKKVRENPNENRFIDFLKVNLYDQMGTRYDKGPWEYLPGAARILCADLGFYSFSPEIMRGGDIIRFSKIVKLIHKHPDFFLEGKELDSDLNGMDYNQFMETFGKKMILFKKNEKGRASRMQVNTEHGYKIVRISDVVEQNAGARPIGEGAELLNRLNEYTDWCICGEYQSFEYSQYTAGGGAVYIMMKDGFENVPKEAKENCPLDPYGLSLICVIVGPDGLPDNITTRWNHENGGENPEGMNTAVELQGVTGVDYFGNFSPRPSEELRAMHMLEEEETPSAMDQVHNKVNAGVMDAVTGCGMMEEEKENTETWYRGYNSKYGSDRTHLIWLTEDISYARSYGNRVEEVVVDMSKLNLASLYDLDDICGYEVDYYDGIDEEDAAKAMEKGFDGYEFEVAENEGYYCLCIWNKSVIVSRRELSKEEFDEIEKIEGYDNTDYDGEVKQYGYYGMYEGAEPEADEYTIGGEGGNNEYFHAMNESKIGNFDFKKYFKPIAEFMHEDGLNVKPYPKVKLDWSEQDGLFIKTGYYEPESKTITIFCNDRHPKDILRTFCHEMIHHSQNLDGVDLNFNSEDAVKDNDKLEEIESEAYLKGNVYFRKWTEYANKDKEMLQEGKERKNDEGEVVPEKCDKCGGDVVCQIHGEPVFVCKDCGKYFGTMPFTQPVDESINISQALKDLKARRDPDNVENWLNEDTDPNDIDLSSFDIKTQLNPKFWKDGRLDSRIRMKLLDIADDFIEFLGIDWVKPDDIIMTGSLANYNWNKKFSDIDLHILVDYSKVDKRTDFVDNYFYSQKKLWNEEHEGLKIYGFPVELYVQDTNEEHSSTGVYSLDKDKWLVEPERKKLKDAKINKTLIKNKVADYIDKIEKLLTIYKEADDDYKVRKVFEDADKLFDKIKKERKEGLKGKDNEITNGNLVFKCLRRLGYIEKITDLMSNTYDKMNSLS